MSEIDYRKEYKRLELERVAMVARIEELEAENARLRKRIDVLEDQLDMCSESLAGEDW